jgi:8-oxo-dGTP pyrophosphatase MutT (NUDIX family)
MDDFMKRDIMKKFSMNLNNQQIIGRDRYIQAAVLIPIVYINGKIHLLFQLRNKNITQGGEVCFPGGRFDSLYDKNFIDTAIRESYEELGVEREKINVIGKLGTLVASRGLIIESYIGFLDIKSMNELSINKDEVERVFTIPLEYFMVNEPKVYNIRLEIQPYYLANGKKHVLLPSKDLDLPETYHEPWGGNRQKVYVYNTDEGVIWGITGELVYELVQLYRGKN